MRSRFRYNAQECPRSPLSHLDRIPGAGQWSPADCKRPVPHCKLASLRQAKQSSKHSILRVSNLQAPCISRQVMQSSIYRRIDKRTTCEEHRSHAAIPVKMRTRGLLRPRAGPEACSSRICQTQYLCACIPHVPRNREDTQIHLTFQQGSAFLKPKPSFSQASRT